jgi:hypothetical protein
MTNSERAALVCEQRTSGTENGEAIAALASSQAAALRFNNTLSTINTTIRNAATTGVDDFVAGLVKGEGVMQSLKDAATDLGKTLTNAGLNSLVTTGLNSIGGVSQTATATASATILTTAGTSLAASMVAGATSAAGILGTGGTVTGAAVTTGGTTAAAELTSGGAEAGGFIATAAAALGVSTAALSAAMGPLAAIAAVAAGVAMVFGSNKQVSSSTAKEKTCRQ